MATNENAYGKFETHCCFCGIVLGAYRTRSHPEEPYPDARWDSGYPGDYVSVDELAWSFEFRALRDSRGTNTNIPTGSDLDLVEDTRPAPFFTGIGLSNPMVANSRVFIAPSDPSTIYSDPGFQPGPQDAFSNFTPYVSFDGTSGRGFLFHAKCFEIFRILLPDRFKDRAAGRRAHYVKSEIQDRLWEILSSTRARLDSADIPSWDDGISPYTESINDGSFPSFAEQNTWSSARFLLDTKAYCGKGMLPYIAADPLQIPKLQAILDDPPLVSAVGCPPQRALSLGRGPKDLFSRLPNEILDIIMCQLKSCDVTNLRLAVRSLAESPLTNSFFRSRFKEPHEMHFVYESTGVRSTEGKVDWEKLYLAIKALLIASTPKDDCSPSKEPGPIFKNGRRLTLFNKYQHLHRFYRHQICPRDPPSPGLANRLRIHVILKPLVDRITLLIDTPVRGDQYRGILSFLDGELSKYPSTDPVLDDYSPIIASKIGLPTNRRGIHYFLEEQGRLSSQSTTHQMGALTGLQVRLFPLIGRSRVRVRKTISAGPTVNLSNRDQQECYARSIDQRHFMSKPSGCVEHCGRKCTWDPNAVVTGIGFSFVGGEIGKFEDRETGKRKHVCGLRFWGRLPSVSEDETIGSPEQNTLLGEVGYIMDNEIIVTLPQDRIWAGFMVGVKETGIVRLKPLTHPPWKEAQWMGPTEPKQGSGLGRDDGIEQLAALAGRRAEGFKVIGPVYDPYVDSAHQAAEGKVSVKSGEWTASGVAVGLGTLRFTSIALIEYRDGETTRKQGKGKGKATDNCLAGLPFVVVDGEQVACEPLPLGLVDNIINTGDHFDGVPDLIDRYCWRPRFPVPHYNEDNISNITLSPRNLSFAFPNNYIQDVLLSAGLPVPPEPYGQDWSQVPQPGQPHVAPILRVPRNRDELNTMEYFDFGGLGGEYLRRIVSIKAFYSTHTNNFARCVSGFEFTYEMDETDVKECGLRDNNLRPHGRYVEIKRGGTDAHYLTCTAAINGSAGERIVRVGTQYLYLKEGCYAGVMLITNFGRKIEFPACPPPVQQRPRRRLRKAPRMYPSAHNPPPPDGDDGRDATISSSPSSSLSTPRTPAESIQTAIYPVSTDVSAKQSISNGTTAEALEEQGNSTAIIGDNPPDNILPNGDSSKRALVGSLLGATVGSKASSEFELSRSAPVHDSQGLFGKKPPRSAYADESDDGNLQVEDSDEIPAAYEFFDTEPGVIITGFFGYSEGKSYHSEGLKAFGIVTQIPNGSEQKILNTRGRMVSKSFEQLEAGAPTACFSHLERARYWKMTGDCDIIKDFISKVSFEEPISRVRVYCRPFFNAPLGTSRRVASRAGLIVEYHEDDLVDDGCDGLRPRASQILGEIREDSAAGCFELAKDERIDGIWIWCGDRSRTNKTCVNDLGYLGVDIISALRFRTDKGRLSETFGGDKSGTCHLFESSGKKKLVGLRMTYDHASDWISPIWREEEEVVSLRKPDLQLFYIPFNWDMLKRVPSQSQVFADLADDSDFGPGQIRTIRGFFDYQFRGLTFIYKSGETRSFGQCNGSTADFNLEEGERVFALKYRPGNKFALYLSLVKINPNTGVLITRSTPLFGLDISGFGLPPLNGPVEDSRSWKNSFDDKAKRVERVSHTSIDDSSEHGQYQSLARHSLEGIYENHQKGLRVKADNELDANAVEGYFHWDEDDWIDIRPSLGYGFAGLWLQVTGSNFRLGMMVTPTRDQDMSLSNVDYSLLEVPSPPSSLLPVLDPHVDADSDSTQFKTFAGRPFVPPLPWLGSYPTDKLPGDAVMSRKIGAQVGAVRLWASFDKYQAVDITVFYSFPTRLAHIHGMEFTEAAKCFRHRGGYRQMQSPTVVRFGTTGFMTTLVKTTKVLGKLRERRIVGLKVGMVPEIYERMLAPGMGTPLQDIKLADWPIKARRTKGGEPQIVSLELILDSGDTVALTADARESTHRGKCPPRLIFETVMCPEEHEVVGFHGNFGLYCHAIGIISAPYQETKELDLLPPIGLPPIRYIDMDERFVS
ncbi:hypothetical protein DRE_01898 [Drechslerella stenobrocha 248]|uniref:F-box domain-containing protein n=1 Tax=Drechslerella stenobrocha 248 TaxID=1043628 RepID=W7HWX8_9PEZI|nr:hypothetical protein DRE_01898 [Drechslerella stenobrocha 248]